MTSDLYTYIAHKDQPYANPMGEAAMNRAADLLDLPSDASACDFGAGFCELALRLANRWGARVAAIELSPRIAQGAERRIAERPPQRGSVSLLKGDAGTFRPSFAPESMDLCACIGATHALGGYHKALEVLVKLTRPGGKILVGEGFWTSPEPSPSYLAATGIASDEFMLHFENIEHGIDMGLQSLWSITASPREWDEYEWAHAQAIEAYAAARPDDDEARQMLQRSRNWRRAYLRWGREHLGFGLYLFHKPG